MYTYEQRPIHMKRDLYRVIAGHNSVSDHLCHKFLFMSILVSFNLFVYPVPEAVRRGGGLGSNTIFKNSMSPTLRRKCYLTTGRRAH